MDILAYVKKNGNFPSLLMGVGTVLAGTAAAAVRGNMEILPATVCLLYALFMQLGANYFHNYCQLSKYYDRLDGNTGLLLPDEKTARDPMTVRLLKEAATACILISLMLGMTIMAMAEDAWWTIIVGVLLYGLNAALSLGPRPLFRTPWAVVAMFIMFGPLGVVGTALLQCQHEAKDTVWSLYDIMPALYVSVAMGFLSCNTYLIYSYRNFKFNTGINPEGITPRFGLKTVEWMTFANGLLMFVVMCAVTVRLNFENPLVALIPAVLGFVLNTYISLRMRHGPLAELAHLNVLTKVNYVLTAVTLFIIWWLLGTPDDSVRVLY